MQKYKTLFVNSFLKAGLVILVMLFAGLRHPFYVGLAEIQHNSKNQSLELSIRLFTDDFEKCLSAHFKTPINLYAEDNASLLDSMVALYINQHFKIYAQKQNLPMHFVGYEKSEEATWSYFELPLATIPETLQIHNTLLYDCIREQSNIMHLKTHLKTSSYKLNFPDSTYQWVLYKN
ncbi:MAG: hypothetical protein IPM92_12155 [Saprospiraceae bacterium]|nr:hypothetical protein [Saprospiraceae bacterium]